MSELYFLLVDDWDDVVDVYTDEDEAIDRLVRESEEWYIKPVVNLNEFTERTIQRKEQAEAVIERLKNSLNSGGQSE